MCEGESGGSKLDSKDPGCSHLPILILSPPFPLSFFFHASHKAGTVSSWLAHPGLLRGSEDARPKRGTGKGGRRGRMSENTQQRKAQKELRCIALPLFPKGSLARSNLPTLEHRSMKQKKAPSKHSTREEAATTSHYDAFSCHPSTRRSRFAFFV